MPKTPLSKHRRWELEDNQDTDARGLYVSLTIIVQLRAVNIQYTVMVVDNRVAIISRFFAHAGANTYGSRKNAGGLYKSLSGVVDDFASPFKVGDILGYVKNCFWETEVRVVGVSFKTVVVVRHVERVSLFDELHPWREHCIPFFGTTLYSEGDIVGYTVRLPDGEPKRCKIRMYADTDYVMWTPWDNFSATKKQLRKRDYRLGVNRREFGF